jgi:hypothetical protein
MADLSLKYLLFGEDRSASKTIKGVGAQAQTTAGAVGSAVGRIGETVGGEVGDMLGRVSAGFEQVGERGKGMAPKLMAGGSAIMGLGVAMQAMASSDVESMNQLDAAVEATGRGYDAFGDDVDKLIAKQVAFGHTDGEVTTALRVLTQAYGDPKKALDEMALATDLAAAKHISLEAAAAAVGKAHGGAGKLFKEFGVVVAKNADGTKDYDGALTALSGKLAGQASASMDSFGGKVRQAQAWLENQASALAEKYGPAVTIAGGAVTALGSVMQVLAARSAAAALATSASTTAVEGSTLAMKGATVASRGMALAAGPVGLALTGLVLVAGMFAKTQADASARADGLRDSLDQTTGAITDQTKQLVALQLQQDGTFKLGLSLGVSQKTLTDAALGNADAVDVLKGKLAAQNAIVDASTKATGFQADQFGRAAGTSDAFSTATEKSTAGAKAQADGLAALLRIIDPTSAALAGQSREQKEIAAATMDAGDQAKAAAEAEKVLGVEVKTAADKVKTATDAVHSYSQALQDAGLAVLSTRDAQRNLIQSVVDAEAAVAKNGKTLDINTQAGRDNAAALDAQAGKALGLSKSIYDETHSEEALRVSLVKSRDSLVATGIRFGMTKAEAGAYADKVLKIPDKKKTDVLIAGRTQAEADAAAIKARLDALHPVTIEVKVKVPVMPKGVLTAAGEAAWKSSFVNFLPGRASGGPVAAGVPYIVGERRAEVFVPETNGTILPRVGGGGGGSGGGGSPTVVKIYVNGQVYGSVDALAAAVLPGLQRLAGSGVQLGLT